jgi:Tol biopolymer transport system component
VQTNPTWFTHRRAAGVSMIAFLCAAATATIPARAQAQATTDRVSKAFSFAEQPNGHSRFRVSMSFDGRFVAFSSYASNLISGDDNGLEDVFIVNRNTSSVSRVSVHGTSVDGNGSSTAPSISYSGSFVAFHSNASNLVLEDTNDHTDVFVRNIQDFSTTLVSVNNAGEQGDDVSYFASISGDARFFAFTSYATNLVEGDTNGFADVFVRDIFAGVTACASAGGDGASYDAAISGDGRYVAFTSHAENFVLSSGLPAPNGKAVLVDDNGFADVYVYDQLTGEFDLVSVSSDGSLGNGWSHAPVFSRQGRFVAFMSTASNLADGDTNGARDVFVHDRETGVTERVGRFVADLEGTGRISISDDGRYVAYPSNASDLVPDDTNGATDIFVYDRWTNVTERVSRSHDGDQGEGASTFPSLGDGGRAVGFVSEAENLVTTDSNGHSDVFVRSLWPTEVVFADVFEGGSPSSWSSVVGFDEVCMSHFNDNGRAESLFTLSLPTLHGTFVGRFTPESYPFRPTRVEILFTRDGWDYSWLDYEVVFFDDDGPNGAPGTLLGSVPAAAYWIQAFPFTYSVPVMVGGSVPAVTEGSLYVGARWFAPASGDIGIAVDEYYMTTPQETYFKSDGVANWNQITGGEYKSLFIRACGH